MRRLLPIALLMLPGWVANAQNHDAAHYIGSVACRTCHQTEYDGWRETRMANVVRDPRTHPEAVLGDFAHPNPARPFSLDDVAFVYGSRYKQRYFARQGTSYYPLPAQWDIVHRRWLPYHVPDGADWWTAHYGPSNAERPTGPTCDGCHSVGYDLATHRPVEWNVGCEACHGPGSAHAAHPAKQNIVNPETLDSVRGNDVCIQCHSQGRPALLPVPVRMADGSTHPEYPDFPVGYRPGDRLADVWRLEIAKPGTEDFYFYRDGSAHKNRMQGNDWVESNMYHRGLRCFDCHQVHSNQHPSNLIAAGNALCLRCHTAENPAGLKGTVSEHTHHAAGSAGSECTACHMPAIAQTLANKQDGPLFVASHTFRFLSPTLTTVTGVPNPCTACHQDRSIAWATDQLHTWTTASPWRVAN